MSTETISDGVDDNEEEALEILDDAQAKEKDTTFEFL